MICIVMDGRNVQMWKRKNSIQDKKALGPGNSFGQIKQNYNSGSSTLIPHSQSRVPVRPLLYRSRTIKYSTVIRGVEAGDTG
jgi:hypothetical protein